MVHVEANGGQHWQVLHLVGRPPHNEGWPPPGARRPTRWPPPLAAATLLTLSLCGEVCIPRRSAALATAATHWFPHVPLNMSSQTHHPPTQAAGASKASSCLVPGIPLLWQFIATHDNTMDMHVLIYAPTNHHNYWPVCRGSHCQADLDFNINPISPTVCKQGRHTLSHVFGLDLMDVMFQGSSCNQGVPMCDGGGKTMSNQTQCIAWLCGTAYWASITSKHRNIQDKIKCMIEICVSLSLYICIYTGCVCIWCPTTRKKCLHCASCKCGEWAWQGMSMKIVSTKPPAILLDMMW
jgi:hypothetical protein